MFVDAATEDTSTFSIDVDNASYTLARAALQRGTLPSPESVRVEEFINFFDYGYAEPIDDRPFSIDMEVAPSRFGSEDARLLRIGLQGARLSASDLKPTNLVFLIDVSGSMASGDKLQMVKKSLNTLIDHLRPTDTIGIVVYAGADGVALEPTEVQNEAAIRQVIERLDTAGSTNAEAGIVAAYEMAERAKIEGGNNRVIILTDGDFNVGRTGEELFSLIDTYRAKHIALTCMGYGRDGYDDHPWRTSPSAATATTSTWTTSRRPSVSSARRSPRRWR